MVLWCSRGRHSKHSTARLHEDQELVFSGETFPLGALFHKCPPASAFEKWANAESRALSHSLNRPYLLYSALIGRWRYSLQTDRLTATMQIADYAIAGPGAE